MKASNENALEQGQRETSCVDNMKAKPRRQYGALRLILMRGPPESPAQHMQALLSIIGNDCRRLFCEQYTFDSEDLPLVCH